jgi:lipopolysaccharide/colanic/teichoic acid biosynthesis glycosyltransferase
MATSIRQLSSSAIAPRPEEPTERDAYLEQPEAYSREPEAYSKEPEELLKDPEPWSDVLKRYAVDEVVAVTAWNQAALWNDLAEACADRGVIFRQLVVMPKPRIGKYHIEDAGNGQYFVSLETVSQDFLALALKRALDMVGGVFGVMLSALIFPCYAMWLTMVSRGTVLFRQERMGRNGRFFTMYKFRTMRPDAERELPALMALNEMNGAMFKIEHDPRVIRGGNFMRRTHLDELPQFWNVLMGDMSLVGTRPPTRGEVETYQNHHHRRLSMRPGITGLWQVSGNRAVRDFEQVVKLDCEYIDAWSLGLDLRLIGKTLWKVVRGAGW